MVKAKAEEQEFKINILMRNFDSLKNNVQVASNLGKIDSYETPDHILNFAEMETEVRLLRE